MLRRVTAELLPREVKADDFDLRALQDADPQQLIDLVKDPDIQQYIPWAPTILDMESAERRLSIPLSRDRLRYGIYSTTQLIGFVAATREADGRFFQTGSALRSNERGLHLTNRAFEALQPVLSGLGCESLSSYVALDNVASTANVLSRGMQATDELKLNAHGIVERRWEMVIR